MNVIGKHRMCLKFTLLIIVLGFKWRHKRQRIYFILKNWKKQHSKLHQNNMDVESNQMYDVQSEWNCIIMTRANSFYQISEIPMMQSTSRKIHKSNKLQPLTVRSLHCKHSIQNYNLMENTIFSDEQTRNCSPRIKYSKKTQNDLSYFSSWNSSELWSESWAKYKGKPIQ